jgi:hypothetical protein
VNCDLDYPLDLALERALRSCSTIGLLAKVAANSTDGSNRFPVVGGQVEIPAPTALMRAPGRADSVGGPAVPPQAKALIAVPPVALLRIHSFDRDVSLF